MFDTPVVNYYCRSTSLTSRKRNAGKKMQKKKRRGLCKTFSFLSPDSFLLERGRRGHMLVLRQRHVDGGGWCLPLPAIGGLLYRIMRKVPDCQCWITSGSVRQSRRHRSSERGGNGNSHRQAQPSVLGRMTTEELLPRKGDIDAGDLLTVKGSTNKIIMVNRQLHH
ncbi:hypothetical protein EJB05_51579 [Eragrostis curvula]|uniref:Uncharacterized protein n=1 Tax=Eragrostis curvula TaxID=38414 RepID=A0A5J9SVB6_9POAL|nr:hypothetical protein EJB05_51579 [Eragrostis curvula]